MNVSTSGAALAGGFIAICLAAPLALADDLAVSVVNKSEPELCAEKDNVNLEFTSPAVRSLRIQAVHPSYIGQIVVDRWAPDFTSCDMSHDPSFVAQARRVTFFENERFWLTGYTYPSFWRPATVPFKVGDRVEQGLHVVQLWVLHNERAEEVLVVYPPDGYWRARPLPPAHMRWSAYGSSFLVGPVEVQDRPIVDLKDMSFDPDTKTFTMNFARGGSAKLTVDTLDPDRIILDVSYDGPMAGARPFMAMRSMYTTEYNADVAKVAWRTKWGKGWGESPIMNWTGAEATELWAGRTTASRHNSSAPDMVFSRFSSGPPIPPPKPATKQ